jgi:flagellar biosynthesis anti-sigma factor FlgM
MAVNVQRPRWNLSMRIIDSNSLGNCASATSRTGETQATHSSSKKGGAAKSGPPEYDTVELSRSMNAVNSAWNEYAAGRAQRVRELTMAVQSGTYEPDAGAISQKLVDEAIGGPQ